MEKKFFSFLFNTVFYSGIPKETIRMPFRGLTMLKSRKLVIKGGLCYRFAMVNDWVNDSWGMQNAALRFNNSLWIPNDLSIKPKWQLMRIAEEES